jgi:hypothetical protein
LDDLVERLQHLEHVPLYAEEFQAEVVATVEGAWVPAGFLERVQARIEQVVARFKRSTRPVPSDWSNQLWSVVGAGFQCIQDPWEKKGLSKEDWEATSELEQILLMDRGVERNFWHGNGAYLTECLLYGRHEELKSFIQEGLEANELEEVYEVNLQKGSPVAELVPA